MQSSRCKCLIEYKVDADVVIHLHISLKLGICGLNWSVPYCTCGNYLAVSGGDNDLLTKLFDLKLTVVISHKKAEALGLGKVGIIKSSLDIFLNVLKSLKLNSDLCNKLVEKI